MNKNKVIMAMIKTIVACKLHKSSITWDEVEEIYISGKYPEINEEINYILNNN